MKKSDIEEFLNTDLDKLKVVLVNDGEIELEFPSKPKPKCVILYLNNKLNESEGLPKSFELEKKKLFKTRPYEDIAKECGLKVKRNED